MGEKHFIYDNKYYAEGIGGFHRASIPYVHDNFFKLKKEYGANTILDFGCGNGFHAAFLKAQSKELHGVDFSDAIQTAEAKQFYDTIYKFDLGSETGLPTEHFDTLFSIEVIEHVKDYNKFLQNAYKTLKPGGVLFLTTTTYFWSIFILLIVYRRKISFKKLYEFFRGWMGSEKYKTIFVMYFWDFFTGHYHGFSKRQIKRGFKKAGFKLRTVRYLQIQDVVPVNYLRQKNNGRFAFIINSLTPVLIFFGKAINYIFRKTNCYAPNILIVAEK